MPKPLTLGEVARRSRDGEGKDADKKQKTQRYKPCLSETSYRNAAGVISPGLPSQALARQLSQRESPWQRGFVFDETDLRLLKNVTECQSLSLWERWHCEAMTERARMLTKSKKTQRYKPCLSETSYRCAFVFYFAGLALSGADASALPKGEPLAKR